MNQRKKTESELIKELSLQSEKLKEERKIRKIRDNLLKKILNDKSLQSIISNDDVNKLNFEKIETRNYPTAVLNIGELKLLAKEWNEKNKNIDHKKKPTFFLFPAEVKPFHLNYKLENKEFENNPDYFYYQLKDGIGKEYSKKDRDNLSAKFKELISNHPDLSKFINISFHNVINSHNEYTDLLIKDIIKLRKDRLYLYELSKKVTDETKYSVIIEGISKGKFALSDLIVVEKYLYTFVNNKLKTKPVKQIIEYLYIKLKDLGGVKYQRSYIQKEIYKIIKGTKKSLLI